MSPHLFKTLGASHAASINYSSWGDGLLFTSVVDGFYWFHSLKSSEGRGGVYGGNSCHLTQCMASLRTDVWSVVWEGKVPGSPLSPLTVVEQHQLLGVSGDKEV